MNNRAGPRARVDGQQDRHFGVLCFPRVDGALGALERLADLLGGRHPVAGCAVGVGAGIEHPQLRSVRPEGVEQRLSGGECGNRPLIAGLADRPPVRHMRAHETEAEGVRVAATADAPRPDGRAHTCGVVAVGRDPVGGGGRVIVPLACGTTAMLSLATTSGIGKSSVSKSSNAATSGFGHNASVIAVIPAAVTVPIAPAESARFRYVIQRRSCRSRAARTSAPGSVAASSPGISARHRGQVPP